MTNNKPFPRLRALALALAVSAVAVNSQAAEAGNTIQIQAQPLGSALTQLGQQTSLQLFFSPELVAGKQAPAVSGNLAPVQALQPWWIFFGILQMVSECQGSRHLNHKGLSFYGVS